MVQEWERMPAARRHLYFYILLLLAMLLANSLREASKPKRTIATQDNPPGVAAKEVYPAPVRP